MAIRFLSSETIDGALTVNSTVTLNKTNNVIDIPSLVDNVNFYARATTTVNADITAGRFTVELEYSVY